jgi:hypothetical protein
MWQKKKIVMLLVAGVLFALPTAHAGKKKDKGSTGRADITGAAAPILWREPSDIASRNLLYGPGGAEHQPPHTVTFISEDLEGSNPKFVVRGEDGVKWKLKLGAEGKPETVASRLIWAVGYFVNEDYFLSELQVKSLPAHLHRGQKYVGANGLMHDLRLKRNVNDEKKIGNWEWRHNPFTDTRELNGLRVMMALINNWDLKDANTSIYREKHSGDGESPVLIYMVTDLGSSFGTTRLEKSHEKAKGNLDSYVHSKFIRKVDADFVDFDDPHRPTVLAVLSPHEFVSRLNMEWIGRHIPRADAKWIGQLLAQLSPEQIRDAFRAAGYTSEEVEGFARVVESRIAELNRLWLGISRKEL